jgi:threonine/homoserine/homoserine lactone efflux protein
MNPFTLILALSKGVVFGGTVALIPGPIFFLIMQRTLHDGPWIGLLCALGAVMADALYAFIAAIGLTCISQALLSHQSYIALIGGIFLVYLGTKTISQSRMPPAKAFAQTGFFNAWLSTFFLTITNPVTIISYSIIFASLGIGTDDMVASCIFVVGVMIGALAIGMSLVGFLHYFRQKLSSSFLLYINKIAGTLLIAFGIVILLRGFMGKQLYHVRTMIAQL